MCTGAAGVAGGTGAWWFTGTLVAHVLKGDVTITECGADGKIRCNACVGFEFSGGSRRGR